MRWAALAIALGTASCASPTAPTATNTLELLETRCILVQGTPTRVTLPAHQWLGLPATQSKECGR